MKVFVCAPLTGQKKANVSNNFTKLVNIAKACLGKDIEIVSNTEKDVPDVSDNLKLIDYVTSQLTTIGECDYFVNVSCLNGFRECKILKAAAELLGIPILSVNSAYLTLEKDIK